LVYNALDSEHALVQERALKCVPELCESIDYAEVQSVLFPRVAVCLNIASRLSPLTVGTVGLYQDSDPECEGCHACYIFGHGQDAGPGSLTGAVIANVLTLFQSSLTQKLVPLLSKIKTKEPSVMVWLDCSCIRIELTMTRWRR